ncbi:MAG: class I SAM-dependent methyltransferase, partial [Acidimicrobiales bacterium]
MSDQPLGRSAWQGEEYEPSAAHHRLADDWFLARHPPGPSEVVIDGGCGTGEFTARLAELVPDGSVIGVEPDRSMLEQAMTRSGPNLSFREGRLQELDAVCEAASADLVVSRAVFHWIALADYLPSYLAVRRVLRPGGWFHAESGGAGNVARVRALLDDIAAGHGLGAASVTFPDAGTVMEVLEQADLSIPEGGVTTVAQRRGFDHDQLLAFVRTQASVAYVPDAEPPIRDAFLGEVAERIDELRHHDGSFDQTFV